MHKTVHIIGAGLAGCEAAYQIAKRGFKVKLYEMKPFKHSPAHKSDNFAELVCSNSLKSNLLTNACGLLKEEMRLLDSVIIKAADKYKVPAGAALAVDRDKFSEYITDIMNQNENLEIINGEVTEFNNDEPTIIATGPLTSDGLITFLNKMDIEKISFYDAAAPIIEKDSIDMDIVYFGARYDKGDPDYINCPMTKEQYDAFYKELINAKTVDLHEFETVNVFEGCMPVEIMAKRGVKTLLFGPLRPVGLIDKRTGVKSYAVVQLRQDNLPGSLYNMVGFQTNLTFSEQKRVFRMIPGLENAEFVRYGVMHRNTYINGPKILNSDFSMKEKPNIFFAGQITGVEGYVESAASGLLAGINLSKRLLGEDSVKLSNKTMLGALSSYVGTYSGSNYQPMNANFGIIEPLDIRIKDKRERYKMLATRSLEEIMELNNNEMV